MTELPWAPIEDAPLTGHSVFVWNGIAMLWATWSRPRLDPGGSGCKTWCSRRERLTPQPTHWLAVAPPSSETTWPDGSSSVHLHSSSRSPDGASACYVVSQYTTWRRCTEHEGTKAISSEAAGGIAAAIVRQLADELAPRLLHAISDAEGSGSNDGGEPEPTTGAEPSETLSENRARDP